MMSSQESPQPSPRPVPAAATLSVLAVGLGLNLLASFLLGSHLHHRFGVGIHTYLLVIGLPLLVTALIRLPVGVLTDRFGARVMFPAVSLAAAAAVTGLGLADTLPGVIVAGGAAGVAGGSFVVGGALIARTFPYGRRGLILGVFGLGAAVAGVISALLRSFHPGGRRGALALAALLVIISGISALVLRDRGTVRRNGSPARRCLEMIRLSSTTSLTILYALAIGGILAIGVFLPIYLATALHFEWFRALSTAGALVLLASAARLAGGWWADRRPTAELLTFCYTTGAILCAVVAVAPRSGWLTVGLIAGIALCDGVASGVLFALIGKAAPPDSAGAVMGMTGTTGALGAFVPPLLLAGLDRLTHSYILAWVLLAVMLLTAARYVRAHGLHIGLGLAVQFEPEPSPTTMTVAVVGESDTRLGAAAVVGRLAELATSDELIVVYGTDDRTRPRLTANALADGLRHRLPRHSVVAVRVTPHAPALGRDALLLGEYIETGTLTIAVAPPGALRDIAADLSLFLQADRMVTVSYTPAQGAELHPV